MITSNTGSVLCVSSSKKSICLKSIITLFITAFSAAVCIAPGLISTEIISIDISLDALQTAAENAATNNVTIDFKEIDFLDEEMHHTLPVFDVISSNPPYIPENDKASLDKNVMLHEPHLALFVPQNDPLIFYRKIFLFAQEHLTENGKIFLEVHEDHAKETAAIFNEENYLTEIKKDMQGKERMVIVSKR